MVESNVVPIGVYMNERRGIEEAMIPYMLCVAFNAINSTQESHIREDFVHAVDLASAKVIERMPGDVRRHAGRLERDCTALLGVDALRRNPWTVTLAACKFIASLVDRGRFRDPTNQGVLVALAILDEAETDGAVWAKAVGSDAVMTEINRRSVVMGYF